MGVSGPGSGFYCRYNTGNKEDAFLAILSSLYDIEFTHSIEHTCDTPLLCYFNNDLMILIFTEF